MSSDSPLVSIIVPVYNTEKYLKKCLDSILSQTYKNIEVILVDDGSTDGCGKICDDYKKRDKRVVVIHQNNGGQSNARNAGIKKSRGDFIGFVDADDEIRKDFVSRLLKSTEDKKTIAVSGMRYKKLQQNKVLDVHIKKIRQQRKNETIEEYIPFLLAIDGRMYGAVSKLFSAQVIKENNLAFQEKLNFAEDTKFVLEYLKLARPKINFVPEPLYIYNYGTETSTIKKTATDWENWKRSFCDLKNFVGKNPSLRAQFWTNVVLLRWRVSYIRSSFKIR